MYNLRGPALKYSKDESCHIPERFTDAVIHVENVEQVSKIHRYCYENDVAVIPFGQGSGFEGGVIRVDDRPSITIDTLKNMNW